MSTAETEDKGEYLAYRARKISFIAVLIVATILVFIFSLTLSYLDIGFVETFQYVLDHLLGKTYEPGSEDWMCDRIIFHRNMPEAVFAIVAGASLAVAGVAMQSVMNNPLADAYTTGISSGAVLGVSMATVLGLSIYDGGVGSHVGIVGNAFIFSMIPLAIIILVSKRLDQSPASLILAGVAISYFLNAATMAIMLVADEQSLKYVYEWQVGSIGGRTWDDIPLMLACTLFGTAVIWGLSGKLNILSSGEANAKSLGIDIESLRTGCLLVMTLMVASVISYAGLLGFVGLVCPHIVRTVIDSDNRYVVPASAALGAFMMIGAMVISELVASPTLKVPVGVVLSFIGAPIFLFLIIRRKSNVW